MSDPDAAAAKGDTEEAFSDGTRLQRRAMTPRKTGAQCQRTETRSKRDRVNGANIGLLGSNEEATISHRAKRINKA